MEERRKKEKSGTRCCSIEENERKYKRFRAPQPFRLLIVGQHAILFVSRIINTSIHLVHINPCSKTRKYRY